MGQSILSLGLDPGSLIHDIKRKLKNNYQAQLNGREQNNLFILHRQVKKNQ
jgi:hypothetical protein